MDAQGCSGGPSRERQAAARAHGLADPHTVELVSIDALTMTRDKDVNKHPRESFLALHTHLLVEGRSTHGRCHAGAVEWHSHSVLLRAHLSDPSTASPAARSLGPSSQSTPVWGDRKVHSRICRHAVVQSHLLYIVQDKCVWPGTPCRKRYTNIQSRRHSPMALLPFQSH